MKQDGTGPFTKAAENKYSNAVYNWLAPEAIAEHPVTEKSDVYSLCAVMWELLHGIKISCLIIKKFWAEKKRCYKCK